MLRIREEQLAALRAAAMEQYLEKTRRHVERHFRARCAELGEAGTKELVALGVARAAEHGLSIERNIRRYVDLVFTFGAGFDRDPALPWASAILGTTQMDETPRMDWLFETALAEAERLDGERA